MDKRKNSLNDITEWIEQWIKFMAAAFIRCAVLWSVPFRLAPKQRIWNIHNWQLAEWFNTDSTNTRNHFHLPLMKKLLRGFSVRATQNASGLWWMSMKNECHSWNVKEWVCGYDHWVSLENDNMQTGLNILVICHRTTLTNWWREKRMAAKQDLKWAINFNKMW